MLLNQHNILDPLNREITTTTARNRAEILAELKYDPIAYEVILIKNGEVMESDFEVVESDIIVAKIVPRGGGGGLLRTIAMVVVSVFAWYAAPILAAYMGVTSAIGIGMIQAGIAIAGMALVNAVLPAQMPSLGNSGLDGLKDSPTYGWDSRTNSYTQGYVIPKVYGTHKVTPPLIGKYVESINDKQYLNMLFAVNDGLVQNISNIKINGEDIANFQNIQVDVRNGGIEQTTIPWFNDTRYDKSVNQKLTHTDFRTVTTTGNNVSEITAVISFPRGLYYMNDKAQVTTYSVKVVVEYSSDGVNWIPMYSPDKILTYSEYYKGGCEPYQYRDQWGKLVTSSKCKYKTYNSSGTYLGKVSNLPSGAVEIPAGVSTPIGLTSIINTIYGLPYTYDAPYETISNATTSAFRRTFTRKNLAPAEYQIRVKLYEAVANTTRHGSEVVFEYLEEAIADDFEYPTTALLAVRALATDQLSGNLPTVTCDVTANSDNPALICKDILLDSGEPLSNIDSQTFDEWEEECNTNNYKCNIVFDSAVSVRQALDMVSLLGRASIQQFGSKYAVIMDKKNIIPVQTFTFGMGNILKDTFKMSCLPISDRANVIELTWYNPDRDYERTVEEVSNAKYDNVIDRKVAQLNLIGCTNREQALKHAQYQLNCNRYLSETVEFEAYHEALVCKYGDIVGVSHDLPQYGYSGRLVDVVGNTLTLDRFVDFEVGKEYAIMLRNKSNEIEELLCTGTGNTNTVTIVSPTYIYEKYDNYSFGEVEKVNKLYRVVKIATGEEFTRLISCIEYNQDVYNDEVTINIPQISDLGLKSLYISDYIRYKENSSDIEVVVNLKWTGVSLYYDISWKKSTDTQYETKRVYETFTEIVGLESGTDYDFIVRDNVGKQLLQTYHVLGKFAPPPKVENLTYSLDCDEITLSWQYSDKPIDFKHFEVISGSTLLATTETNSVVLPITKRNLSLAVFAVDSSNICSDISNIVDSIPYLPNVEGFTSFWNKNGEIELSWSLVNARRNPIQYEIRKGTSWEKAQVVALTYDKFYKPNGQGNYLIKARHTNIYGFANYSEVATSLNLTGENFVRNVIAELDEKLDGWQGDKQNIIAYSDLLFSDCIALSPSDSDFDLIANVDTLANVDYISGSVSSGVYTIPTSSIVDIGQPTRCGVLIDYKLYGIDLNDNIDLVDNFDLIPNVDGDYGGIISCTPQIQIDGGDWQNYVAGDYVGQTYNFRLLISTTQSNVIPVVCEFKISVDVPDKVIQGSGVTIPINGTTITYSELFNTDTVNVQVTILNSQDGDYAIITNDDRNGFTVEIKNGATSVSRVINWIAQAY